MLSTCEECGNLYKKKVPQQKFCTTTCCNRKYAREYARLHVQSRVAYNRKRRKDAKNRQSSDITT